MAEGTTNFQVWNPTGINQETDILYTADPQRANGATPTIDGTPFSSNLANKLFYQLSTMVAALGEVIANAGNNALDSNLMNLVAAIQATFSAPVGSVILTASFGVSPGYLLMDGTPYSRSTYANLFSAVCLQTTGNTTLNSETISSVSNTQNIVSGMPISGPGIPSGTTVTGVGSGTITISQNATATASGVALTIARGDGGIGDGSTTFNVPDWRGRIPVGAGAGSGLTARFAGQKGGSETHTQAGGEVGQHDHSVTDPGHAHSLPMSTNTPWGTSGGVLYVPGSGYSTGSQNTGLTVAENATPTAMPIMNPFAVAYWQIKY